MDSYKEASAKIKSVLDGKFDTVDLSLLVAPSTAMSIIENDFHIVPDDVPDGGLMETNGWQWDFWKYYSRGEDRFCLSGSGFYGEIEFKVSKDNK